MADVDAGVDDAGHDPLALRADAADGAAVPDVVRVHPRRTGVGQRLEAVVALDRGDAGESGDTARLGRGQQGREAVQGDVVLALGTDLVAQRDADHAQQGGALGAQVLEIGQAGRAVGLELRFAARAGVGRGKTCDTAPVERQRRGRLDDDVQLGQGRLGSRRF